MHRGVRVLGSRMFQAKQRRQQAGGLAFESVPKIPKGGKSDMKGTQTTAAPPAASAKAAPEPKEAPAAAAEGAEGEKEEEKVYDVLPVEELDVSTLTDEQKEHFKVREDRSGHEEGRAVGGVGVATWSSVEEGCGGGP